MEQKKFYITTPIFYANGELHMGHTYTLVLADILARYHREIGEKTFFLTGSDEHGDKIVRAAKKEDLDPQIFVDDKVFLFKDLMEKLNISNDYFIRTSDQERHWPGAMKLWQALVDAGDIYKSTYNGLYCVGCEAFITEKELVDGKCPLHDAKPETISEENYFFKLSKYSTELRRLLEDKLLKITPENKANELLSFFLEEGREATLSDVSISRPRRDVSWGIPVPNDPEQLMYVWCDALSNYISALGYGSNNDTDFSTFWPADVQVMGKDIIRFHGLLWPALLLSAKLPLPKELLVHGFVNSGGKKMSKSLGNVLDPKEFIDEYGVDALRSYLAREVKPTEDWDLTREKFKEVYNANLANGLGNLVSRTLKMAEQYFDGHLIGKASSVPPLRTHISAIAEVGDLEGLNIPYVATNDILPRYHAHMHAHEINKASDVIWEFISHLDQFITDYEPFKLVKTDREKTEQIIWGLLYGLDEIIKMITPIMPETAQKIRALIGTPVLDEEQRGMVFDVKTPMEPLFMRK
ncbi:MAG: methionine--tRNA ligase [Patescibacteria group bacterium]